MATNTTTKNVIKSPQEYYREKERKRYADFCANLKADLSKTDLHPKTKDKYYSLMTEYKSYAIAIDAISEQFNALNPRLIELKAKYESEPNDEKAKKILTEYRKVQTRQKNLKAAHSYYRTKMDQMDAEIIAAREHLDEKLEELGYDRGVDDRPKMPVNSPKKR